MKMSELVYEGAVLLSVGGPGEPTGDPVFVIAAVVTPDDDTMRREWQCSRAHFSCVPAAWRVASRIYRDGGTVAVVVMTPAVKAKEDGRVWYDVSVAMVADGEGIAPRSGVEPLALPDRSGLLTALRTRAGDGFGDPVTPVPSPKQPTPHDLAAAIWNAHYTPPAAPAVTPDVTVIDPATVMGDEGATR